MISRLTGILESIDERSAVVAPADPGHPDRPGPLAYEVLLPTSALEWLAGRTGETITLYTIQHLEQSSQGASMTPRLIGFTSRAQRDFFRIFTTVKGVGPRKALRAMAIPEAQIARAVAERDTRALQRLPEVGKRLAETIVAELSGKLDEFLAGAASSAGAPTAPAGALSAAAEQAVSALVRLGEPRAGAESLVRSAVAANPGLASADDILAAAFSLRS